jgi:hypothetical protein
MSMTVLSSLIANAHWIAQATALGFVRYHLNIPSLEVANVICFHGDVLVVMSFWGRALSLNHSWIATRSFEGIVGCNSRSFG